MGAEVLLNGAGYPGQVGGDFRVHSRLVGPGAALTPACDSVQHPDTCRKHGRSQWNTVNNRTQSVPGHNGTQSMAGHNRTQSMGGDNRTQSVTRHNRSQSVTGDNQRDPPLAPLTVFGADHGPAAVALAGVDAALQVAGAVHAAGDLAVAVHVRRRARADRQQRQHHRAQLARVRCPDAATDTPSDVRHTQHTGTGTGPRRGRWS